VHLLDGRADEGGIGTKLLRLFRVLEEAVDHVADQVGGRLESGDQQNPGVDLQLFLVDQAAVVGGGDQAGDEVVARVLPPAFAKG
jgi:hypothetical protein